MDGEVYGIVKNEEEGKGKSDVDFWGDEMENEDYDVYGEEVGIEKT